MKTDLKFVDRGSSAGFPTRFPPPIEELAPRRFEAYPPDVKA